MNEEMGKDLATIFALWTTCFSCNVFTFYILLFSITRGPTLLHISTLIDIALGCLATCIRRVHPFVPL